MALDESCGESAAVHGIAHFELDQGNCVLQAVATTYAAAGFLTARAGALWALSKGAALALPAVGFATAGLITTAGAAGLAAGTLIACLIQT